MNKIKNQLKKIMSATVGAGVRLLAMVITDELRSQLAQTVSDKRSAIRHAGNACLSNELWKRIEQELIKNGDAIVSCKIGDSWLKMPLSHRLPVYIQQFPNYNRNVGRIASAIEHEYSDIRAIDIGANVGDSLAMMRQQALFPVLCIEGETRFFSLLSENVANCPDVEVVQAFLSSVAGDVICQMDINDGTATLRDVFDVDNSAGGKSIRMRTLDEILSAHPTFARSKFVKIDCDGYDCKILRGATELLARASPVIFFEYDPRLLARLRDDGLSIFPLLQNLGYESLIAYDNFGLPHSQHKLSDEQALERLHKEFTSFASERFLDLCVFHAADADLCKKIWESESQYQGA